MGMFGSELAKGEGTFKGRLFWRIFGTDLVGTRIRALNVKKVLKKIKDPKNILDAGCGDGCYSFYLSKRYPHAQVTAVDINENLIGNCNIILAKLRRKNLVFKLYGLERLEYKKAFDLICCIDVLHYIEEDQKAIKNLRNSLKEGGLLLLHLPALEQPDWWPAWGPSKILDGAVRRGYNSNNLIHFLEDCGFRINFVKYTFGFLAAQSRDLYYQICKMHYFHSIVRFTLFPVLLIAAYLDSIFSIESGQGFLICAEALGKSEITP